MLTEEPGPKADKATADYIATLRARGGETGRLIADYNWAPTSIGPIATWPQSLRTALGILLLSPVPIVMLWNEDGVMLYNDAYSVFAGGRHPVLLGSKVREGWPEVADFNDNVMKVGLAGGTLQYKDQQLTLHRSGTPEPVWMNLDYSPVLGEDGKPAGVIAVVIETTERVQAEQHARLANERIGLALDSGTILGTWVWEIPTDHFTGDERFARTFSVDSEALKKGMGLAEVAQTIHPADMLRVTALIDEAMKRGGPYRAQYRVKQGDNWLWIEANGRVELDADGRPVRFPGVIIDIDQRKRIELQLEGAREQLELAQIAGGIGIFSIATGTSDMVVSSETCRIFGIDVRPVVPVHEFEDLCLPEDRAVRSSASSRATGTAPLDVTYRIHRKDDGALRWLARRAEFVYDDQGRLSQMIGIVQDITDRRRAEVDLMESQAHLALMVESAQEYAILSMSPDGIITSWNAGAERVFGGTPEEMTGEPFAVIFTPEDQADGVPGRELHRAGAQGRSIDQRWHVRTDGTRFYANGITSAMYDRHGKLTGFTKIARDMTSERLAQDNLVAARDAAEIANVAKTEFLANMSHEIRTPMNAIIGLTNLLAMSQPLSARQRQFIGTLQSSADSMLALVNDLLDIAKIEARSVELEQIPFNLTTLVQEVASMMAVRVREKGLIFTGEGECVENRTFIGDPTRIRQIIVNLCSNAIKFTDQGRVHVEITCHASDTLESGAQVETICIAVSDTGIGIAADKIDAIFQKFTQGDSSVNRKFGGTGLGLAITKTLTEIMGGTISVISTEGEGSTFTACIPLRLAEGQDLLAPVGPVSAVVAQAVRDKTVAHVLLVEDYEPNILVATAFLEQFGYAVDIAVNGLEAFERYKSGDYVCALMDVQMHGMNGLEATQTIRAYEAQHGRQRLPIIGVTAHALAGDRERCLAAGMDDYIAKPFNPGQLETVLRRVLKADA